MFNERRISAEEFRENFMKISPFQTPNKTIVDTFLACLKDNKKMKNEMDNNEIKNITQNLMHELDIEECLRPQV